MRNKLLLTALFCFLFLRPIKSQSFLNGSFENTNATCNYGTTNTLFNSYMGNCYAFGGASQIDIMKDTCSFGLAQNGNYFIGLGVPPSGNLSDALSLELDSPLIGGKTYNLSFFKKMDSGYISNDLVIGYSTDSLTFGTPADTVPAPVLNSWVQVQLTLIPNYNARFITIQIIPGFFSWDLIDNFSINLSTEIEHYEMNHSFLIYPNPCREKIYITCNSSEYNRLKIRIFDIFGTEKKTNIKYDFSNIEIDRNSLASGIYFIQIWNDKQLLGERKLIAL
jgi:hypothetical protein